MTEAIAKELIIRKDYLANEPVNTIYFGGGTPSILTSGEIAMMVQTITGHYDVGPSPEITLEANPDDLSEDKLKELFQAGINRLSIGIQSFNDLELRFLNRVHNSAHAIECIENARNTGFNNISIDLIYGIPGQTEESWKASIEKALSLNPEHISAYSLTIEEKTAFGRWVKKGKLKPVEDDVAANHLTLLIDLLEKEGYEQYEVSNFARSGFISKHNSNYWRNEKYLGVGPSAHSYNLVSRQWNISNNHLYIRNIQEDTPAYEIEVLTLEDRTNDYLLTGLRTVWGVDLQKLKTEFQYDLQHLHADYLTRLLKQELIEISNDQLTLTRSGKFIADKISADLFIHKDHTH